MKESGQARLPALMLRKTSLVTAPPPLSRLRDFHSIDFAQKDSVPSLQEVAETFVCSPMTRPERQWPLPKDRQRPQTFLFGQSGIRRCCLSASSSDKVNNGSKLPEKRKASAVCTFRSLHIGKSGTHFVRDVTFSGCSAHSWHRPLLLELKGETEVSHSVTAIGLSSDARQNIHRQAAERLALMGRAVSVSQSLSGLRSSQSQPHGCCQ